MLTLAAVGMALYGVYSAGLGLVDLAGVYGLEWWADLALVAFGLVLMLAAALVRVRMPGGLALALGAMLALQALALHNDAHFYGSILLAPQAVRGAVALGLIALAVAGAQQESSARRDQSADAA